MKTTLFRAGKQTVFLEFSKNLPDRFYITLASIFDVNQDVIKVYNDENIKFFCQDFVNVALKVGGGIRITKKHDLVLEMAVPRLEDCFSLVTLTNSHLMI